MVTGTAGNWRLRLAQGDPTLRIHLLGIGGAGLSAIATVLYEQGFVVSGSDRQASPATRRLAALGVQVFHSQQAENLTTLLPQEWPDVVLISSAVAVNNPERQAAEELGIPVVKRSDFLPIWLADRQLIAVAGAAGKTTTTAMIVKLLCDAGVDAGYIIGAELPGYGNAAAGSHSYFVIEADEYDHMFLALRPAVAIVTNVVWDHPDCYPTPESFVQAFRQFVELVPPEGLVISCADDPGAERLLQSRGEAGPCWVTYGLGETAEIRAAGLRQADGQQVADLIWSGRPKGQVRLAVPGPHNVTNGLAALAVAAYCAVPLSDALVSLAGFQGTSRRFEVKGEVGGVVVVDDYAHHPIKVQATLAAARSRYPERRIWAVIQPHTFSRTKQLLAELAQSFTAADVVVITDIYAAREHDDGTIHARDLVAQSRHPNLHYVGAVAEAATFVSERVEQGDVVVVMGAGDSYRIGELILASPRLRELAQ